MAELTGCQVWKRGAGGQCHGRPDTMSVLKTSVSVVYVTSVVYIAAMLEIIATVLGLASLFFGAGWGAHLIYVGRAERRHRKADAARQYWKAKYHEAIKQRNEARASGKNRA